MSDSTINVSTGFGRAGTLVASGEIEAGLATLMFVDGEVEIYADRYEIHVEWLLFTEDGEVSAFVERHRQDFLGFTQGGLEDADGDDDEEDCLDCIMDEAQQFGPEHDQPIEYVPVVTLDDLIFGDWRNPKAYV